MKRHLLILPLCLCLTAVSAVNLDSLWGVWNDKTQPDTNRLEAMYDIARGHKRSQPDSSFYFAQMLYDFADSAGNKKYIAKALYNQGGSFYYRNAYDQAIEYYQNSLKIAEEIGDKRAMSETYYNLGENFKQQDMFHEALIYYQMSLKIAEEIGDKRAMGDAYNTMGFVYRYQGKYKQALEYFDISFKIFKETGDKQGMAYTYINMGIIYSHNGNHEQGLKHYIKGLELSEEIEDKYAMANALGNMGIVYSDQGDYGKALEHHDKSLKISEATGHKIGMARTLINIGVIYHKQGNYEQAREYYKRSLYLYKEVGDKKGIAASYFDLGGLCFKQGDYPKAVDFCKKGLAIAQQIGETRWIKLNSGILYKAYKETGQFAKALQMHELYVQMCDSLNSIENKEAAIKLEYQYQYEKEQVLAEAKHQEQMALSAEREKRQQLIAYSAGGGLVMVLAFAFFILNRLQVTRRQKKVIEEQKQKVEEQKKDITDSIYYAENIQKALLPAEEDLSVLPEGFVLFQPKDIVSGDFYWMQHHNDKVYFAACDCTGHGVPGAFMSMIGSSLLDEAVVEKGITQPNEIFFEVRKGFINALKQTGETQKDGMDAVLITWDKGTSLQVAAAYSPVLIISNGEMKELKPDRQPVGFHTGAQIPFTHHELKLEKGDAIYLFSDGYPDQFGGPKDKKFMMKNFKKLLLSIQDKTMNEQKSILETTLAEWKGDTEQVDDILVMGVRF